MSANISKKYILFGAGKRGVEIAKFLGWDSIDFFLDNNINKVNSMEIVDTPIISLEMGKLKNILSDKIIIITPQIKYSKIIAMQLEDNGIENFILWDEVVAFYKDELRDISLQFKFIYKRDVSWVYDTVEDVVKSKQLRQNLDSQVEMYLVDPFEIYHFLPIYNELISRGIRTKFVVENKAINLIREQFEYEKAVDILENKNIEYNDLLNPYAKVVLSTQFSYALNSYKVAKKIKLTYFAVTNKIAKGFVLRDFFVGFDYIFVVGDVQKNICKKYVPNNSIVMMGYPKHIEILNNPPSKESVKSELNINTDKKIIVYFPTYGESSSIRNYGSEIGSLRDKFYVVSKPHHCTMMEIYKDELNILYENSDLVVEGNYSFAKMALVADIAIIDGNSSAVPEVAYLNSDCKVLLVAINKTIRGVFDIDEFAYTVRKPNQLNYGISELCKNDSFRDKRKVMMNKLYFEDYNQGLQNAVLTIESLL